MKQDADRFTPDLLGPPRRGRPRKPDALTPAERARRYRARKRADSLSLCAIGIVELPNPFRAPDRGAPPPGMRWDPSWPFPVKA